MNKKELFEKAKVLVDLMDGYRKTGVLKFKDVEEKLTLQTVYSQIYSGVKLEIACDQCVTNALNILTSWYGREYPLYLKSLPIKVEEVKAGDSIPFIGIAQEKEVPVTKEMKPIKAKK